MKTLYLDCGMGVSGDMLMAALFEVCDQKEWFLKKMSAFAPLGVSVRAVPARTYGIQGTGMRVMVGGAQEDDMADVHAHEPGHEHKPGHEHSPGHEHEPELGPRHKHEHEPGPGHKYEHESGHNPEQSCGHAHKHEKPHAHRTPGDVNEMISGLDFSASVKEKALSVYEILAGAEAKAHGVPVSQVHFHEVGQLDAVADIIGVCLLMELISPGRVLSSPVSVGTGRVRTLHGVLPVPAPATANILCGMPMMGGPVEGELCTPTGAALLKAFVTEFLPMPGMVAEKIGIGIGSRDFGGANCLRACVGEGWAAPRSGSEDMSGSVMPPDPASGYRTGPSQLFSSGETVAELCCNIDDMTPESLGYACGVLQEQGALEVFVASVMMKKSRPGFLLTCLCETARAEEFARLMLTHTTTRGLRGTVRERMTLESETVPVQTPYGTVRIKLSTGYGIKRMKPEYDDVMRICTAQGLNFAQVWTAAMESFQKLSAEN